MKEKTRTKPHSRNISTHGFHKKFNKLKGVLSIDVSFSPVLIHSRVLVRDKEKS